MKEKTIKENTMEKNTTYEKSKKRVILTIAVLFLVIAAVVSGVLFFMPKNIAGAWELIVNPELPATQDEVAEGDKVYYVFDKPDKYGRGKYCTCYQGGVEYYEYELLQEDSVQKINLGTEDLDYKITGSKFFGNAELTIVFPEYTDKTTGELNKAQEYVFEQADNPQYENLSYEDFETDSKLLNEKWTSNERTLEYLYYSFPYTQTVEFTDGGIMIIHYESEDLMLDRYMYYAYTAKDSELAFSLVTDKETKYTVDYDFDEDDNLEFTEDLTSASVFADSFFGGFTFYTAENLTAPSQVSADEMYLLE